MEKNHSPTQARGHKAESQACHFLQQKGFKLLRRNFRTRYGEIDLIMEDSTTLIVVEVRLRPHDSRVSALESIDKYKQKRIIQSALIYLQQYPTYKNCRFDVVAIHTTSNNSEIIWIKDAFQVQ